MKKTLCTLNCKKACIALIVALATAWGLAVAAGERSGSADPGGAGEKLVVRQVALFTRDNPAAPWRPVKEKGGLIFNNDCTVRIVCELTVPKNAPIDKLQQSVIVKGSGGQVVLLDRQRPAEIVREQGNLKTVSTALFPCFQAAPAWMKQSEPVVVTVTVHLGKSEASASVKLIYDLAE